MIKYTYQEIFIFTVDLLHTGFYVKYLCRTGKENNIKFSDLKRGKAVADFPSDIFDPVFLKNGQI